MIRAACDRLIALEDALNRLDARAGDGDTGSTAAAGARSIVAALPRLPLADPAATCRRIGDLLSASMGGSSGVLLSAGSRFSVDGGHDRHLRIPFTAPPDELTRAAAMLAESWRRVRAGAPVSFVEQLESVV